MVRLAAAGAWRGGRVDDGSGSAVFGLFTRAQVAREAQQELHQRWRSCFMTHTCQESVLLD